MLADEGKPEAEFYLATCYREGYGPKNGGKDFSKAFYWMRRAAEHGYAFAMNDTGYYFEYGIGTEKSIEDACYWYEKAGEAGDASGYSNLGRIYYLGEGGCINYDKALATTVKLPEWDMQEVSINSP